MPSDRVAGVAACLLLLLVAGAAPIPAQYAIPARVERTLSIPAGQTPMHMPTAVAVDSKGTVFVVDGANDRIVRFSAAGEYAGVWAPGVRAPTGICVDREDRLWVADTGSHRLVRISDAGAVDQVIELPAREGSPAHPTDLRFSSDGSRLYVADDLNQRLLVRNQKAGRWTPVGGPGKALGQFQYPFMLSIGAADDLYVSEAVGARVQIRGASGKWAGQIGHWGVTLGQLYRPKGIAAGARGTVYVSDSTLRVIQAFTPAGQLEGILTDENRQILRFEHPMGMTIDGSGRLLVVELKANRVAILKLLPRGGVP